MQRANRKRLSGWLGSFISVREAIYITTPIYYVNDIPHIGHSYTTIIADVLARYYRLIGRQVFFLTGTDEHGQKIEKAAQAKGMTAPELVDEVVLRYRSLWKDLNISQDRFIRTTDSDHVAVVQTVFKQLYDKGHIYLGEYEGLYCHHCEAYYTDTQANEKTCPDCGRELTVLKEEAFFFRLSTFSADVRSYILAHDHFVLPMSRRNEILSYIDSGLTDLCISRTTIKWGIEVPDLGIQTSRKHYVYVWFDALLNYLSGVQYQKESTLFETFWPPAIQLIGKDILKFHALIWPAMLFALKLELPKHVFGHGFIYQGGEKMSKSKGNVLSPYEIIETYGVDAFRYFLSREMVLGQDGTYSDENMLQRYNSDLANDYGNLLNRTLTMMGKYFDFQIGIYDENDLEPGERVLKAEALALKDHVERYIREFKLSVALESIFSVIRLANKYIEQCAPWTLYKNNQLGKLMAVMVQVLETLRLVSLWLSAFMPNSVEQVFAQLNIEEDLTRPRPDLFDWGYFKPGKSLGRPEPIFPRK